MNKMENRIILGLLILTSVLVSQVNTESMRSSSNQDGFQNKFDLDIGYEKANSEVLELSGQYRFDYIKQDNFHSFMVINLNNGYEKENDSPKNIITNKGFVHLRATKNVLKNFQTEAFTQYEFNDFLLLNDRYLLGSGIRIGFNRNLLKKTYLGMGFMLEKETYNLDTVNEKELIRSTNYIRNNFLLNSNIEFNNTIYFQIATDDLNDYRILFDSNIEFHTNDFLSFSISLNYRYDNDPHGDLGSSYIQITNGLSFNF